MTFAPLELHSAPSRPGRIARLAVVRWLVVTILVLGLTRTISAQQNKTSAMGDGLSVNVDWWNLTSAGGGYCPVRVQITNTTPRQRPLRVVIESRVVSQSQNEVVQSLELPPSGKADFVMSLPITSPYENANLQIFEHGQELKKLRIFGIGGTFYWGQQTMPTIAVIGNSSPDLRNIGAAITQITTGQNTGSSNNYAPIVVKPSDAPTKWIDYTTLDFVLISVRELDQMPAAAREALVAWALAGGKTNWKI